MQLEDDIDTLEELDRLRKRTGKLLDDGRESLRETRTKHPLPAAAHSEDRSRQFMEHALVLRALYHPGAPSPPEPLSALESMSLDDMVGTRDQDDIPVLRAAAAMQALVIAPDSAVSEAMILLFYWIVRELFTAVEPDWLIGGARAGANSIPTAFMTGECCRAVQGFAEALENTANFLAGISSLFDQQRRLENIEHWRDAENRRLQLHFYITIIQLSGNTALRLEKSPIHLPGGIEAFLRHQEANVPHAIDHAGKVIARALKQIERFRKQERGATRSDGHEDAVEAVKAIQKVAEPAPSAKEGNFGWRLNCLAVRFRTAAERVRQLLQPAVRFLSSALDRELAAAASSGNPSWDAYEMAFAAASYGAIATWEDERLARAGGLLSRTITDRGRFPIGRPIHSMHERSKIYTLHVVNSRVTRAFAQILQHVTSVPVDAVLTQKMLFFFEDSMRLSEDDPPRVGWHPDEYQRGKVEPWSSALSILALDRLHLMLDGRINHLVYRHFSIRRPSELAAPALEDLFYGDYGLLIAPPRPVRPEPGPRRSESVATVLERMRAHVKGIRPYDHSWEPLSSLILHGPPGTGKTTLIEALAKSCDVPLVEVTPSDLAIGGGDLIERRGRAVFKALSLLTRTVVLFDEFDPILKRRQVGEPTQSIFSFLTPGMLPKLKALNEASKGGGIAYALITNLIRSLDAAAIRTGRFDYKVGVYPPDLLSRYGRLVSEVSRLSSPAEFDEEGFQQRLWAAVRITSGCSMESLVKKGWYVRPKDRSSAKEGTLFAYLFNPRGEVPARPEAEAGSPHQPQRDDEESSPVAIREFLEWSWIQDWDARLEGDPHATLAKMIAAIPAGRPWPLAP